MLSPPLCSFMTPLHVAAERAHNDIMEVLQKHGAKVRLTLLPPCIESVSKRIIQFQSALILWLFTGNVR